VQISLTLNAKPYTIEVEEGFAPFLKAQIARDFDTQNNNELKTLLYAYVRQTFALYEQEKQITTLLAALEKETLRL
jgi:hypothetical protein